MNETSILEYSNLIQMKREYLNIRIWNEWNEYTWIFEFETSVADIWIRNEWNEYIWIYIYLFGHSRLKST